MALKNEILSLMEERRGAVLSGTALAESFGVSRNAVHKAINSLKSEGHLIETVGRQGYRLSAESDRLSAEAIRAFLGGEFADMKIFVYDEVGSTNEEAKRFLLSDGSSRAVFAANSQTAGRGHFGREFKSPAGSGLYLSVLLHPSADIAGARQSASDAAKRSAAAIERVSGAAVTLTATNGIMLGGKKAGGILSEADADLETGAVKSLIIGIGIYVTEEELPPENAALGVLIPRSRLAAEIVKAIFFKDRKDTDAT